MKIRTGLEEDFKDDKRWKVSASQCRNFARCQRYWGFTYLDGIRTPSSAAAALGTATHKQLEKWLGHGIKPDDSRAGDIASRGLHLLPDPQTHEGAILVEVPMYMDVEGILFRGFVDVVWQETEGWVISDHKTSSNPRLYGLNAESMFEDVQVLMYAVWGIDYTEETSVRLQWTYFPTKGSPKTEKGQPFPVGRRLDQETANGNFEKIVLPIARGICDARARFEKNEIKGARDLPINPDACGDFGGCPHAGYCPRSKDELLTAVFGKRESKKTMGLKDILKNKKKAPPRASELPSVQSPEAPETVEQEQAVSRAVEHVPGNAKGRKDRTTDIAIAAAEGEDPQAAADRLEAEAQAAKAPPKLDDLMRMVYGVTPATPKFCVSKAKATDDLPYMPSKVLTEAEKLKLIWMQKDGVSGRVVRRTERGSAAWDAVQTAPVEEPAQDATPVETAAPEPDGTPENPVQGQPPETDGSDEAFEEVGSLCSLGFQAMLDVAVEQIADRVVEKLKKGGW